MFSTAKAVTLVGSADRERERERRSSPSKHTQSSATASKFSKESLLVLLVYRLQWPATASPCPFSTLLSLATMKGWQRFRFLALSMTLLLIASKIRLKRRRNHQASRNNQLNRSKTMTPCWCRISLSPMHSLLLQHPMYPLQQSLPCPFHSRKRFKKIITAPWQ